MEKTNLTVDDLDLIDKYLKKELAVNERILVEDKLAHDEEWQDAFLFQKELEKIIRYLEADSLKARLLRYSERNRINSLPWLWAATISFLILMGLIFYNSIRLNENGIFRAFFEPHPNTESVVSDYEYSVSKSAFELYESKQYIQALEMFNESDTHAGRFYASQCLLMLGQTNAAMKKLEQLTAVQSDYTAPARWYLGLAALKLGRKSEAIEQFVTLSDDLVYESRVRNILSILK